MECEIKVQTYNSNNSILASGIGVETEKIGKQLSAPVVREDNCAFR